MNKESTCIYNANRHASKIAKAYCTWAKHNMPMLPPHIRFSSTAEDCKHCKCYAKEMKK